MKVTQFDGVLDPEQFRALTEAHETYCCEAGVTPGTPAHAEAAWLLMTLFSLGISTAEGMSIALAASSLMNKTLG
jgi:hypothetical protein